MTERMQTLLTPDGVTLPVTIEPHQTPGLSRGTVILAHGITADRDESGAYIRLSAELVKRGFSTLRFDFRGHGHSNFPSEYLTCAGEAIDLKTVVDYCGSKTNAPLAIVAASFGAVSVAILANYLAPRTKAISLWNPVVDLQRTFIAPELPWGIKNFSGSNIANVSVDGHFEIDGNFSVGVVFWEELHHLNPTKSLAQLTLPIQIIHGDQDTYVPYDTSVILANSNTNISLKTISGSDHGFERATDEREVIIATADFLDTKFA